MVEIKADPHRTERSVWMSALAKAPAAELAALWKATGLAPDFAWLRPPEAGSVMVRGRAGGTGAAFNLGETTVTRCALRLGDGTVGHAYVGGHDPDKARIAALCDALLQTPAAELVRAVVLAPLAARARSASAARAGRAAATRVDFFTLARGEDA